MISNKVQLIVYPNSLGSAIPELHHILSTYFSKAVSGVHLLPFYPSSADRGFAPLNYDVDPEFGEWADVDRLGEDFELVIDFMLNHVSRQSTQFQDYIEKGQDSEYADMFLSFNKLGITKESEVLKQVYTRKPKLPYQTLERPDGSLERVWNTFNLEQIDVDWDSPTTHDVMGKYLRVLTSKNIKMIRLDAVAYTTVVLGTKCFFEEPFIWDILNWCYQNTTVELLPEVHEHYTYQEKLSDQGYWCYDFALPMLVLHSLYTGRAQELKGWLSVCPRKQITTLDTHDGIGVVDVKGLLSDEQIDHTLDILNQVGSNVKKVYSGPDYQNLDIYQVNATYYSALGEDDDSYLAARTIQFFCPGVPQVYYVGMLAGRNDIKLVEETKLGRNINRHNYTIDEIETEIQRPVVKRLLELMELRNTHPAFNGDFTLMESADDELIMRWTNCAHCITAFINLNTNKVEIKA